MGNKFFCKQSYRRWAYAIIAFCSAIATWGQTEGERTAEELVNMGFENVRWTETDAEIIYTIENSAYKIQEVGVAKAIQTIQKQGLPMGKRCKVIVTRQEVPEMDCTQQRYFEKQQLLRFVYLIGLQKGYGY